MSTASVSELKAHLSRYLREVRRGGEVEVLDRGAPVARLVPPEAGDDRGVRERLIGAGLLRPGAGSAAAILESPAAGAAGQPLGRAGRGPGGSITRLQRREVLDRLGVLAARWDEVTEVLAVRTRADALLARHPLRAADAGQLGAALLVQEQLAEPLAFACRDQRLLSAADREGLRILA